MSNSPKAKLPWSLRQATTWLQYESIVSCLCPVSSFIACSTAATLWQYPVAPPHDRQQVLAIGLYVSIKWRMNFWNLNSTSTLLIKLGGAIQAHLGCACIALFGFNHQCNVSPDLFFHPCPLLTASACLLCCLLCRLRLKPLIWMKMNLATSNLAAQVELQSQIIHVHVLPMWTVRELLRSAALDNRALEPVV